MKIRVNKAKAMDLRSLGIKVNKKESKAPEPMTINDNKKMVSATWAAMLDRLEELYPSED